MEGRREVVGRHLELEQLAEWLGRVAGGLFACVLTGPAGLGKTTVWRRGLELADAAGFLVLSARPGGAEARLSYAALSDLLAPVEAERLEGLPGVQRHALEVALLRSEAGGEGVDARAIATGLLTLLRDLSAAGPVLLAVDDAQWLDAPSAAALSYALRRLEAARVGVLASIRIDEDASRQTFVAAVAAERRLDLALRPLSVASMHAILRQELGWAPARPTLVRVTAASGGNPFYALEIVRELDRLGATVRAERVPVPRDLQALVRARLARLPVRTRQALLEAACLAAPSTAFVEEVDLAPAEAAGVVRIGRDGRVVFAHPLFAAAVYESAPTARRRSVHRALAARVPDGEESARHLALASSRPDGGIARRLDAAVALARARGATAAAAELAEMALELSPVSRDGNEQGERLLTAAGLQFDTGDLARAQELLERARDEAGGGLVRARALRLLGQLHGRRSSFADALALALAGLDAAAGNTALVAELELDIAYYRTSLGDFAGASRDAQAAVRAAERSGNKALLASALSVRAVVEFLCGNGFAEGDVERALALLDRSRPVPVVIDPRFIHGLLLLWTGRADEALGMLDAVRAEALVQGRESEVPLAYLYLAWACVWRGDLERAGRLAEEGRETASLLDDRASNALVLSACALANAYRGRSEQARADATQALALFGQLRWHSGMIWARWALGFLELSLGDAAAAHATLAPLAAVAPGSGDPVLGVFLPDAVEALVRLGRVDEAEAVLHPFADRSHALDRAWALAAAARCRSLIEAARGDLDAALAAVEEALGHHDAQAMPFEWARTQLELGRLRRRRKQKRLARQALEEALTLFEALGSPLWAQQARAELARVATRGTPTRLTPTEERIARLAAEGLTNRAIAEQAFVSVKTVEANLVRAYRKLGVSSRAQLARALDRDGEATIS